MARRSRVTKGSGNIFADLGLENSLEHLVKARLVMLIGRIVESNNLTQTQAATMMGLRQPDVPKLLRGRFEGFSLERLLFFVRSLGSDIEIKIRPTRPKQEGRILVTT
jgi:predicted XRE-type DNA-binding protein